MSCRSLSSSRPAKPCCGGEAAVSVASTLAAAMGSPGGQNSRCACTGCRGLRPRSSPGWGWAWRRSWTRKRDTGSSTRCWHLSTRTTWFDTHSCLLHICATDVSDTFAASRTAETRLRSSARLYRSCPVGRHGEVGRGGSAPACTHGHVERQSAFRRTLYMRFCRQVSLLLYTISYTPPLWPPVKMRPSGVVAMLIMGTLSVLQEYRGSACTTRLPTASPLWSGLRQMPNSTTCRQQQGCQALLWPG